MSEIEEIKFKLNIVELVSEYLPLKRAGSNYNGLCPFHNEKSPSFMVSEEKQIFHCFGCAAGGDVFEFLMRIEGIEFREALKILAKKAGVALKTVNHRVESKKSQALDICEAAALFYHDCLIKSSKNSLANVYLEKREVNKEMIKHFCLGYSPSGWGDLRDFLKTKGYSESEMLEAGLLSKSTKSGKVFDRFRNRLMFPIYNAFGNCIGFSARVLDEANDKMGKYINSPQSAIYNKSAAIYGLYQAKNAIKESKEVVFVEGQLDVIASHQAGIKNVVASSGTALTEDHLQIIKRYASIVKLCFDDDKAGKIALLRASKLVLSTELVGQVIELAGGKDPDEILKASPELFTDSLSHAENILDYYFNKTLSRLNRHDAVEKEKITSFLLKLTSLLKSPVQKAHYLQRLSVDLGIDQDVLKSQLKQDSKTKSFETRNRKFHEETPPEVETTKLSRQDQQLERLLALLHSSNELWKNILWDLEPFLKPNTRLFNLYKLMQLYYTDGNEISTLKLDDLAHVFSDKPQEFSYIQRIFILEETLYGAFSEDELLREFIFLQKSIRKKYLLDRMQGLQDQLRQAEAQKDHHKIKEILDLSKVVSSELSQIQG